MTYIFLILVLILFAFCLLCAYVWKSTDESIELNSRGLPDVSMLPESFVVFDLETTGLNPSKHEIIEIGAIRVNRDSENHKTFTVLVIPKGRISSRITEITGINRKMINSDGVELAIALQEFRDFIGELPLVAYNSKFDLAFLTAGFRKAGLPKLKNNTHCALKLARRAWPDRDSYKLIDICADGGVSTKSSHRALPDCERALQVFVAAAVKLGKITL